MSPGQAGLAVSTSSQAPLHQIPAWAFHRYSNPYPPAAVQLPSPCHSVQFHPDGVKTLLAVKSGFPLAELE